MNAIKLAVRRKTSPQNWRNFVSVLPGSLLEVAAKDSELRLFIVAGEVSGDIIGSRLIGSLKKLSHLPLRLSGVGGSLMRKEGLESIFPMEDISVMGLWELLPHLHKFRSRLKEAFEHAQGFRPHAVVTLDSKGFCFRFLKLLQGTSEKYILLAVGYILNNEHFIPTHFHYVSPSFWAWKGGEKRLHNLSNFVDHLLCILPNEAPVFRSLGLSASFVGHPVLEEISEYHDQFNLHQSFKVVIPTGALSVSVLPGSRMQEILRMLPIFQSALSQLRQSFPNLFVIIHVAPNKHVEEYIRNSIQTWNVPHVLVPGGNLHLKYNAFRLSKVALCTSGSVALELHLAKLPFVVAYRAHFLTELVIKYKAKIPYISLPNILLECGVVPEALFGSCTPSNLAELLENLISKKEGREQQKHAAAKVKELLLPCKTSIDRLKECVDIELPTVTPSLLAAFSILSYRRR